MEVSLHGGRITSGVVRLGDTVRRPCGNNSAFVHALLQHLESVDFPHSPRLLGVDAKGREILSFVEGWVPADLGDFTLHQLREAARVISLFHSATADTAIAKPEDVVCHCDLSPCNFVFSSEAPACIIDFDLASPGPRRLDVGYAAWLWLDIDNLDLDPHGVGRKLAAFLSAYGEHAPSDPLDAIVEAQLSLLQRATGPTDNRSYALDVRAWSAHCTAWMRNHREGLERGLNAGTA